MRLSSYSALTVAALLTGFTALTPLYPTAALAQATSTSTMQTQLQNEWKNFVAMLPANVTTQGDISLTKDGFSYVAALPILSIPTTDGSTIKLENIKIKATPDASGVLALNIMLPNSFKRLAVGGHTSDAVTIGQHNIQAAVKPTADGWVIQNLDSNASKIKIMIADDTTSIDNLAIKGTPAQTTISGKNLLFKEKIGNTTSIAQASILQNAQQNYTMRLSDVFGLLSTAVTQNNIFKSWQNSAASATITLNDLKIKDNNNKDISQIGKITTENKITHIQGDLLTLKSFGSIENIKTYQLPMFADILPQSVNFSTTTRNVPARKLTQATTTETARRMNAEAGTQIQIEKLEAQSQSGLKIDGTGLFTATETAPAYAMGNANMTISNLSDALAKLQTKAAANKTIGDTGATMMAIMMIQGMGRTSPDKPGQALYQVNISPNGQIKINDQDFSKLANILGMGNAARKAAPSAINQAPQNTPQSTPWLKK
jgi:Trp operon repressor